MTYFMLFMSSGPQTQTACLRHFMLCCWCLFLIKTWSPMQLCWEKNIEGSISTSCRQRIWNIPLISKSVCYRNIQMKILHRAYITPIKCNKINASFPDRCMHGGGKRGAPLHCPWESSALSSFWSVVINALTEILQVVVLKFGTTTFLCVMGKNNRWAVCHTHEISNINNRKLF